MANYTYIMYIQANISIYLYNLNEENNPFNGVTEDNKEHNMHFCLDYLHLHEERTTNKSGERYRVFQTDNGNDLK